MTLELYECGAKKRSAQFETEHTDADLIAFDIYRAVIKAKALVSKNFEVTWDPNTDTGLVFAGMRTVGKVRRLK
jgi:hypothetical protein